MITDGLENAYKTKRLLIRAFENTPRDRTFLHTQIENDPVNVSLSMPTLARPRAEKHSEWMAEQLTKAVLSVMLCLAPEPATTSRDTSGQDQQPPDQAKDDSTPIGYLCLGWGGPPADQAQHRSVSLGITLAAAYQGQGYGAEAIDWALDWAFRFGGYHRVSLGTTSFNERAQRLYRKLGFVEEGRAREAHYFDRRWYDMISYGMLEGEWEVLRVMKEAPAEDEKSQSVGPQGR
ncbi:hypothetical protein CPLU01_08626 [Colletotrichum plurivorum]|uniref:N-acetyltransferase domain-containing protein n=1 Tax=Colletotrichum plurivorum TaxID=2175906 RepID=A0A8H6KBG9_9PEZI|nr:hypothetical protein CPLU01_08626 [Colletotrichum plurivorum]